MLGSTHPPAASKPAGAYASLVEAMNAGLSERLAPGALLIQFEGPAAGQFTFGLEPAHATLTAYLRGEEVGLPAPYSAAGNWRIMAELNADARTHGNDWIALNVSAGAARQRVAAYKLAQANHAPALPPLAQAKAIHALIELLSFIPEAVKPADFAKLHGLAAQDVADAGTPFFSEAFLYAAIGKEDARTVDALLSHLCAALGLSLNELETAAADRVAVINDQRTRKEELLRRLGIAMKRAKADRQTGEAEATAKKPAKKKPAAKRRKPATTKRRQAKR